MEDILKKHKIAYKIIDEETNIKLLKINSKLHVLCIYNKNNKFTMERDYYEYLDGNSIPYSVFLKDTSTGRMYYLDFTRGFNWVKGCFESCDKDELFLGKQVLNSEISEVQLLSKLGRYF